MSNKPKIVLLGRANVGKSTLFNRICKFKEASVHDLPGITRDRKYQEVTWNQKEFILIDTGGFFSEDKSFSKQVRSQVESAILEADILVMVFDGKEGLSPFDVDIVNLLRKVQKTSFFLVNKSDNNNAKKNLYDFFELGIDKIYPVSAEHGNGIYDFLNDLTKNIENAEDEEEQDEDIIKIAIVGRPNVGKSSLINKILKEDRVIVSDTPGTTRDSIDISYKINNKKYILIDTAGIRKKSRTQKSLDKLFVTRSFESIRQCDVALIMIDAEEGITDQDVTITGYAYEKGCAIIFLINKWDLLKPEDKIEKKFKEEIAFHAKYISYAPALSISALTGLRVSKIFDLVDDIYEQYKMRIPTSQVNKLIMEAIDKRPPPYHKNKRIKINYVTQYLTRPPSFVIFTNYPKNIHFSYKRYLINQIKEKFNIDKINIKVDFKLKSGRLNFNNKSNKD